MTIQYAQFLNQKKHIVCCVDIYIEREGEMKGRGRRGAKNGTCASGAGADVDAEEDGAGRGKRGSGGHFHGDGSS